MELFSDEKTHLHLPNAEVIYIPQFYNPDQAKDYFNIFRSKVAWQQDHITLFGKTHLQPRLTALYAMNDTPYSYSNIKMIPQKLLPELVHIKKDVENTSNHKFTSVLLNLYRDGKDSNGWHADNEKSLGKNPVIASVSFGASRTFHFKHRNLKQEKYKLQLESGSLLIMQGEMQHFWLHQISKTKKPTGTRINLTFRTL